jgi:DNA-binding MarR family transcriptional regulator
LRPQRTNVSAAEEDDRRASKDHSGPRGVTLSGRDIEDAKRLLALLADQEPNAGGSALPRALYQSIQDQHAQLVKQASRILALRRRRAKQFGKAMFSEPAWEMLLLLYATQHAERLTATRLALLSGGSKATALRWIEYLVIQKWVTRSGHPTDRRAVFVSLTEKAKDALDAYLFESIDVND